MEKCRGCGKSISRYLDKWWDESEDYACSAEFGEHVPNVAIRLPDQKAYATLAPVAKWRKNGQGRIAPLSKKNAGSSGCIQFVD